MELEKQVTSLKLSKRLRKLGVKQESYFKWWQIDDIPYDKNKLWKLSHKHPWSYDRNVNTISAFTVAELGEMLPDEFYIRKKDRLSSKGVFRPFSDRISFGLTSDIKIRDKTEANARAKILIYLKENKLMRGQ